jgi:hypothetical protein
MQLAGTPAGRHVPGRQKCAAPNCPKTAKIRLMVRGPDGRLYGSGCHRKLFGTTGRPGNGRGSLNHRGATVTPGTLFDQPAKETPAMSQATKPTATTTARRFVIERKEDPTGVSGTGPVIDGVLWPDGTVSVRWRGDDPSFVNWLSLAAAERIHCFGGHSRIVWIDKDVADMPADVYYRATYDGPDRVTMQFNTNAMMRNRDNDTLESVIALVASYGLRPMWMPGNAPMTFDVAAHTLTTRYIVSDDAPDCDMPTSKAGPGRSVLTEDVTIPYSGELPPVPTFLDRPASTTPASEEPTA